MRKTMYCFALVLGVLFILNSCEYSPSEIPLTEVERPSETEPSIWIDLKPGMDTLKLTSTTNVICTIDAGDQDIYRIEFFLDEVKMEHVYFTTQNSGYTEIPVYQMANGLHELKIRAHTSTNSGSIADKMKAEQYQYEMTWPIVVNKEAKKNCKIIRMESTTEGIKIVWNKYDFADCSGYRLNKYSYIMGKSVVLLNTHDTNLNSFVDNTYIEGDYVSYELIYIGVINDLQYYHEEIKLPKISINANLTFDVNLIQSKYPQNVKSYFLKTTVPLYGYSEEKEILDLNQTSATFNEKIGFGGNYEMQLRYIPKGYEGYNIFEVQGGLTEFALGDSVPAFERGFLIGGENTILTYKEGKFSKYNYLTGQKSTSISITSIEFPYQKLITCSVSGNLFGYFEDNLFVVRRTSDWSLLNKMDIGSTNNFNLNGNNISISDNGKVAVIDIYNYLRIFDFRLGTKILEKESENPYNLMETALSSDGKSLIVRLTNYADQKGLLIGYNIESNKLEEVNRLVRGNSRYESSFLVSPVDGKIIYLDYSGMYQYNVDIINPQTFVVESSIKSPQFFKPIAYDYETNRVIAQYQSFPIQEFSYLLDVKTGKQSKIVQFVGKGQFLFSNGTVYSGNGRSIKIDDYILQ